ncbi:MAG: hypothetical protein ACK5GN_10925 [Pseudomonadota bacterium]
MVLRGDFARMGQAIKQRHERCAAWWQKHLEYTATFIGTHVPSADSVAVLGAGRLLDIDLEGLISRCRRVHLFDADPTAEKYWRSVSGRAYGKQVIGHITDITESIDSWTKGLPAALRRGELINYLNRCVAPQPRWAREQFDGYISLNILGQIPLYWRDRVLALVGALTDEQWCAVSASMGRLQESHLRGLAARPGAWSILITDTEYYFYRGDESQWRVEPALFGAANQIYSQRSCEDVSEAWLWHIAPQFVESDEEGEIHRVEASLVLS